MRRSIVLSAALIGFGAAVVAKASVVPFSLVSHSVEVNRTGETATFTLEFDHPPNFHANGNGQPDAFQYEIDADTAEIGTGIGFNSLDTVIRGGEIWEGNGLPVRDRDGEGGSNAGGWGPVRALLPFEIEGNSLSFTTGLSAIGDHDGQFRYRVFTTQNGEITGQAVGAVIPFPAAIWTGLAMLSGVGISKRLRRI